MLVHELVTYIFKIFVSSTCLNFKIRNCVKSNQELNVVINESRIHGIGHTFHLQIGHKYLLIHFFRFQSLVRTAHPRHVLVLLYGQ